ncbi:MAG: hypothetical protein MRQ09_06920 [Candidatus Midichloria sp.]|nr:hypothetical protein [Candidatus Midichloria sp.]
MEVFKRPNIMAHPPGLQNTATDLSNDGRPDIVNSNQYSNSLSVLLNIYPFPTTTTTTTSTTTKSTTTTTTSTTTPIYANYYFISLHSFIRS